MIRTLLIAAALLVAWPLAVAEDVIRTGQAYATVKVLPDGAIEVEDVKSDLPSDTHPAISDWLERQAIELAADVEEEAPNRTTVQIDYTVVEDDQGSQGLIMKIAATGVGMPDEEVVAADMTEIEVRVRVRRDGTVAYVKPVSELPEGISEEQIEQTVRQDIEGDPSIRQAAAERTLVEDTHTLTVQVQSSDN